MSDYHNTTALRFDAAVPQPIPSRLDHRDWVGSSSTRSFGLPKTARARPIRWRWPPESMPPEPPMTVSYPWASAESFHEYRPVLRRQRSAWFSIGEAADVVGYRAVEQLNILRQVAHVRPEPSRFHAQHRHHRAEPCPCAWPDAKKSARQR